MIQDFLNYLSAIRGYSQNTIMAYRKDLTDFVRWMRQTDSKATWSTITREDIDAYVTYGYNRGLKPATTNRQISSISSLYGYFRRQGLPCDNPCKLESRRKVADTIPNTIPVEDINQAYKHARGATKIMLGLLAATGIRIGELLSLKWEDIDFDSSTLSIMGKGSKGRLVPTTKESLHLLAKIHQDTSGTGTIFHIDQRTARYMIWTALRPYSNAKQLSPHAIRHTFATHQAAHGTNVTTIAHILGHKHLETTQKYIDMTQSQTRQVINQYSII